ncbi:F-box/LRR-repeat protein At1g67190-like [Silene latifolia]|uniref:F-box/LRR-repeat protein At1g67190-like n=1 Tax=Silene latifolia TaxID=37657 RepID=UPI003D78776B
MLSDTQVALELNSSSLKAIYIEAITLVTFILEAGSLEELHLKFCIIKQFTFIGKGSLKHFEFEGGYVDSIDLGEVVNLEVVDVSDFTFSWLGLYQMISRSSNLRVLRIWAGFMEEIVYLEAIAKSFPYLTSLSFGCDLEEHWLHFVEEGSYQMQHLVVVEVGWEKIHDQFCPILDTFLEKCPIVKKLNVHGKVSATRTREECQTLANFTSSMIQLMRKYMHVDQIEHAFTVWKTGNSFRMQNTSFDFQYTSI